ncbi:MAG: NAD(P)-dependent oxidoreductase [Catenulispora sp.]|nr:NAD(P)-dependent oxidoreductase [Catenulispora sp.]
MTPMSTILLTGAAGGMATLLRPRLARPGRVLRLLDTAPLAAAPTAVAPTAAADGCGGCGGEELVTASITDLAAMTEACAGAEAVIHLAGQSTEADWDTILDLNIHGTYTVLEAARRAGVSRVVLASSNHVVGYTPRDQFPVADYAYPRPDSYYGVSKAAGEALGSLYHDRYGLDVICVRILSCFPAPTDVRTLSTWLSPDDAARLMEACLAAERPGFRVVFGVSANTRGVWVSLEEAMALGFRPLDDA